MSQATLRLAFSAARPMRQQDPRLYIQACRSISNSARIQPFLQHRRPIRPSNPVSPVPKRKFSSTSAVQATVVAKNPRVDDDGKEMTIEISERAAKRLKQITSAPPQKNTLISSPAAQDAHLRVTVTSGGCHGFQYLMSLEDSSKVDEEEDTIFACQDSEGAGKAQVVMDQASLELLKGSTIDFTTELIGSQFKIVGNPRATSSCGCGTSFDIE
ncbi:[4Fe-4S] proteins maturation [Knufia peltigerae]|uniref:[4Fe-4S] proteins maturation n=1 Tax=Knufia peltigerae TaxID=1002370 RepID=A0AA38YAI0_9EURO|nr:[4Fe-4S] proteins maturation [Knufia peltigerae]